MGAYTLGAYTRFAQGKGKISMSKYYGDMPCVNLNGIVHITVSGTKCACGRGWAYGKGRRSDGKFANIVWRTDDAVTCTKCKEKIRENKA